MPNPVHLALRNPDFPAEISLGYALIIEVDIQLHNAHNARYEYACQEFYAGRALSKEASYA